MLPVLYSAALLVTGAALSYVGMLVIRRVRGPVAGAGAPLPLLRPSNTGYARFVLLHA